MNKKVSVFEYVWPDRENGFLRSKVKVIPGFKWNSEWGSVESLPVWNFDGSSTGQDLGKDTEVILKPVKVYRDPFQNEKTSSPDKYLVLCQLDLVEEGVSDLLTGGEDEGGVPVKGFNTRYWAQKLQEQYGDQECWFGLEQEYVFTEREGRLVDKENGKQEVPYRWADLAGEGQGNYYCSVRFPHAECGSIARQHLDLCLEAGIKICGLNGEVLPSQWEFQVGPGSILEVGDDLMMARFILLRLACNTGLGISFHPKIISGQWNGSGCHINFSTKEMRMTEQNEHGQGKGIIKIMEAVGALENDHPKILKCYGEGEGNELRLTGKHETSSAEVFNYGVGTRETSIRIPNSVYQAGGGYMEDRRPASNIDPYLAMGGLMEVVLGPKVYTPEKLREIGEKLGK